MGKIRASDRDRHDPNIGLLRYPHSVGERREARDLDISATA
ncbi:hypothetical protein CWATWH0402_274 [Crocosphaera watsonii WH 0402]|uniref:Uncharacterized protein n=2 Tax=Crocosphaera watsonii TaxID=263511 RepID=T2JP86_CROWT|nr:hypothetical protein [Crocosphaera watsonii]EHJ11364.1 hypothetical protein CWATWH0003_3899 [Crocosphaera watsonii WH 0003]CCQ66859.1 hypothetical protein CWATWH0402_274 [Crocosphaera watsonii WH 0402]